MVDENEVERPEEENARLVEFVVDTSTDCMIQWFYQWLSKLFYFNHWLGYSILTGGSKTSNPLAFISISGPNQFCLFASSLGDKVFEVRV